MRHAYLIMAHNQFYILEKLLLLLDDARNDIYLHIDAKVEKFDFVYFENLMKRSTLYYVKRLDVRWGNISIVHCVVNLLKVAFQTGGGV